MTITGSQRTILGLCLIIIIGFVVAWQRERRLTGENQRFLNMVQNYSNGSELCERLGSAALHYTNTVDVIMCLQQLTPWAATPPWGDPPQPPESTQRRAYDMMDRVRTYNQRAVIARLRALTHEDLGEDAKPWIEKYARTERKF